ncbi:hypothetical protein EON80_20535 [bacterium]|nr:MAG: hypothetical protein EON80_20535 [bacterium]
MQERIDPTPYCATQFLEDIRAASTMLNAPFSEEATRRALQVFDSEFSSCVVQLKAVCKPGTGIYYRFFYNGPEDLTARALKNGLIESDEPANVQLQAEVLRTFPGATRAGLDFDSGYGLAKVWTFTGGPVPIEQLSQLPSIPQSVRDHAEFFARHGLRDVFFVASDYQGSTMNVYFGWSPECRNREWIERMVQETDGAAPSPELCDEILATQAASGGVGTTFSWERPEMLRWCLYSLEAPIGQIQSSEVTLPQRLETFLKAPTNNLDPQFNIAWSFGGQQTYIKVEKSYARDATYFLTQQMGGDLSHPALAMPA